MGDATAEEIASQGERTLTLTLPYPYEPNPNSNHMSLTSIPVKVSST